MDARKLRPPVPEASIWPDQDANGVDLAHLRRNLALSPRERLEQYKRAAMTVALLRRAARRS